MVFFRCKACEQWERQYRSLQLEVADLRQANQLAASSWAAERQGLVDRVLAVEQPAKAGLVLAQSRPLRERTASGKAPVLNLPGIPQDLRPKKAN